jgi:hypothetical protein
MTLPARALSSVSLVRRIRYCSENGHHGRIYILPPTYIGQTSRVKLLSGIKHLSGGYCRLMQYGVEDNTSKVRESRWPVPPECFAFRPVHFFAVAGIETWSS